MNDEQSGLESGGPWQLLVGIVVTVILAYGLLTTNILLGIFASALIVFGYYGVRWLVEFTCLMRRLVVALERIAENTESN